MKAARRARARLAPWAVLALTSALAVIVALAVHRLNDDRLRARFDSLVADAVARVQVRMAEYEAIVRTARAFFAATGPPADTQLRDFMRGLAPRRHFPGIVDLAWASQDLETAEEAKVRAEAMQRARDEGEAAVSAPLPVTQRTGFALFVPVYDTIDIPASLVARRLHLAGYVYATFHADSVFRGIFGPDGLATPGLMVAIRDGDRPLYLARPPDGEVDDALRTVQRVTVGGRQWDLDFRALAGFAPLADRLIGVGLGITGLAVGLILFALVRREVRARDAAEQLAAELARRNGDLDEFAYVASHDLKAPLRGIANLARWIEEDTGEAIPVESRQHLALMQGRVVRLERLIDGILDYSRAGRQPAARELVDCDALVRETFTLVNTPPQARMEVRGRLPRLHTVRTPLAQVYLNLLSNAIKHAGPACLITVAAREVDDAWEMSVADDGPGIAPEYRDKIFGLFQTLKPRDRLESTGIGLAVVRRLVEQVGGKVWVTSREGSGADFRFTWPKRVV